MVGMSVPPVALYMVCLTIFIDSLGGSISAPVLPFYAKEFRADAFWVGVCFSAFSLAQVIFLPIFGQLSDKLGRRFILVISLFGAAFGAWGQALAVNFDMLILARLISGACGAVGSTANVYVCDVTSEGARGQWLGYLMSANGAAFAFGPGLGGGLSHFGLNVPIAVNGVLCLLAGCLTLAYLPESPVFVRQQKQEAEAESLDHHDDGHGESWMPAAVWAVVAIEFLRGLSFAAIFAFYGIFASQVYGLGSLAIGYVVCVGALTLIATNVWVSCPLQRRIGNFSSAAVGVTLMAGGELALVLAPTLWASLLGVWVVYAGQAIAGANIAALTSTLCSDCNRGKVMSMQQMAQALGRVVGPPCLGSLSETDIRLPFVMAAGAAFCSSAILTILQAPCSRGSAEQSSYASPEGRIPSKRAKEDYTKDDIEELGRFLCQLLTDGHYKWHGEDHRSKLKAALRSAFPPLLEREAESFGSESDPGETAEEHGEEEKEDASPKRKLSNWGSEVAMSLEDSNFLRYSPKPGKGKMSILRSPALGRAPYKKQHSGDRRTTK